MIKIFTLKSNWVVFLIVLILSFAVAAKTHAIDSSESAQPQKYGITFPIAELGNCVNLNECKTYCDDMAHQDACISFAKKHGFYKAQEAKTRQNEILALAKVELGCDNESACKEFCGNQENWQKCGDFARKHGLGSGPKSPQEDSRKVEMLLKAKQFLGCDSYEACKAICTQPVNRQKCEDFARQMSYSKNQGPVSGKAYENASSRASFCRQYPEKCQNTLPNREMCQNLKEKMGSASAEQIKAYYLKYCAPPNYQPKPSYGPATKCQSYPGCTWTGTTCHCSSPSINTSGNTGTSSSVKGISTVRNFLQTLMEWFR